MTQSQFFIVITMTGKRRSEGDFLDEFHTDFYRIL